MKLYSVVYACGGYTGDPVTLEMYGTYTEESTANIYAEALKHYHRTDETYIIESITDQTPAILQKYMVTDEEISNLINKIKEDQNQKSEFL